MEDAHTTVSVTNGVGVHPRGGATADRIGVAAENALDAAGVIEQRGAADRSTPRRTALLSICTGCVVYMLIIILDLQKIEGATTSWWSLMASAMPRLVGIY